MHLAFMWQLKLFKITVGSTNYLQVYQEGSVIKQKWGQEKKRAIIDFNGNLLTHCGKTYRRAFLSWIAGMALSMMALSMK